MLTLSDELNISRFTLTTLSALLPLLTLPKEQDDLLGDQPGNSVLVGEIEKVVKPSMTIGAGDGVMVSSLTL